MSLRNGYVGSLSLQGEPESEFTKSTQITGKIGTCPDLSPFSKDIYVALGAGILHYSGNLTVALPSFWGKFATLLQIVTVALVLLGTFVALTPVLLEILFSVTALVTTIACVHYISSGVKVFKKP